MWVIFILFFVFGIFAVLSSLRRKQVLRLFSDGNVIVTGKRGRGKDMLFSFVINAQIKQRNKAVRGSKKKSRRYISNVDYTNNKNYIKFDANVMTLGGNTFDNFITNNFVPYNYPYEDGLDFFISDAGIYFPSQYYSQLDKRYPSAPMFQALTRHLGNCNFHCNVQNLNRLWDKIREQSDTYILCKSCRVFFKKYAVQKLLIYDNYESALSGRLPFPRLMLKGREGRMRKAEYNAQYGHIQSITLIHTLKNKYDDRIFKKMLSGGVLNEKKQNNK